MLALALVTLIAGCGSNVAPPAGIALTPDGRGDRYFAWSRQYRGGDYNRDPQLVRYVRQIGERLVRAAGLLPSDFQFIIVNHPDAAAWATPAANIALSRGLLLALENEAELAAILAHEIAHAQLRHFDAGEDTGTQENTPGTKGVQLELAADARSIEIMARAGYRPDAAYDSLLRLQNSLDGDAPAEDTTVKRHRLSIERLVALRSQAAQAGRSGRLLADEFDRHLRGLRADAGAYRDYEEALGRLRDGDPGAARAPLQSALAQQPGEYLFHVLAGEYWQASGNPVAAGNAWARAIVLQPDYYRPWLLRGWLALQAGDPSAVGYLRTSHQLLPSDQSALALGLLALSDGATARAGEYFRTAAAGDSPWSEQAGVLLARMELAHAPARYITASISRGEDERLYIDLVNRAPIAVSGVEVAVRYFTGERWRDLLRVPVAARLRPGEHYQVAPVAAMPASQADRLAVHLVKAQPADD